MSEEPEENTIRDECLARLRRAADKEAAQRGEITEPPSREDVDVALKTIDEMQKRIEKLEIAQAAGRFLVQKLREANHHDLTRSQFEIGQLKERLDKDTLKWTNEAPAAPGWYWVKFLEQEPVVFSFNGRRFSARWFNEHGEARSHLANEEWTTAREYAGPIPEPLKP